MFTSGSFHFRPLKQPTHHHVTHHSVAMREIDEQHISVDAMEESGLAGYEFYRRAFSLSILEHDVNSPQSTTADVVMPHV